MQSVEYIVKSNSRIASANGVINIPRANEMLQPLTPKSKPFKLLTSIVRDSKVQ